MLSIVLSQSNKNSREMILNDLKYGEVNIACQYTTPTFPTSNSFALITKERVIDYLLMVIRPILYWTSKAFSLLIINVK